MCTLWVEVIKISFWDLILCSFVARLYIQEV